MATVTQDFSATQGFNVKQDHKKPSVHFQSLNTFSKDDPTPDENQGLENWIVREDADKLYTTRPRSASHHLSSTKVPSRKWLKIQAQILRALMAFALHLPKVKAPKRTPPNFTRRLNPGPEDTTPIDLYFYTPANYEKLVKEGHRFPILVNFHGGGFCLGHATDDHNWARVVLKNVSCVVVSVNYRLAPECPFPAAVDDAVDALLYLSANSQELGLDPTKIALSGFSAGANLAFTVPLRLEYHTKRHEESKLKASSADNLSRWPSTSILLRQASYGPSTRQISNKPPATTNTNSSKPNTSIINKSKDDFLDPFDTPPDSRAASVNEREPNTNSSPTSTSISNTPLLNLKILTIVAWYPLLDWTISRAEKKRTSLNPPKTLPKFFTDLFDYSYLPPPDLYGYHCSPYASPGLAPDHMLRDGLPADIQMWLCEWDMLLAEGKKFSKRLQKLGKSVEESLIEAVPHGFDQSPNPWRDQEKIDHLYERACGGLKLAFAD
jgi:putative ergosteryl-3beta-O-L-aspartate hydrolase